MFTGWTARLLSVLRIVVGFMFMMHGTQKLFGFPAAMPGGPQPMLSLIGVAGVMETIGGALMIAGLLTRPVAFLLSGQMAVAYFRVHAPAGFWPLLNNGELAALYCFTFLFFSAAGAGPWSVDALVGGWRKPAVRWTEPRPATVYPHRRAS
jgi:putative oxidoreductase